MYHSVNSLTIAECHTSKKLWSQGEDNWTEHKIASENDGGIWGLLAANSGLGTSVRQDTSALISWQERNAPVAHVYGYV